jgi:glutamate/tyrosine decarboxylase-like PLP-dependent enzyme
VVGHAGTVNTGAIDELNALADLAVAEGLWFHVDGAFGAVAYLSPALRPRLAGMERADSLAVDLHKWLHQPIDVGCLLVRDAAAHLQAFASPQEYLEHADRGPAAGEHWFLEYGPEFSRPFRAMKVWLSLKAHGVESFIRLIEQNVSQARYLAGLVEAAPDLEVLAPVSLNVVCFRLVADDRSEEALNELNREVLLRVQEAGLVLPSGTTIAGQYALRAAITNHRTRREDLDLLVAEVRRVGREVAV